MKRLIILILAIALLALVALPLVATQDYQGWVLQSAATTGNGTAVDLKCPYETTFYVSWATSTSAGAVTIETATSTTYAGTWAPVAVVTYVSGAPSEVAVSVTGCLGPVRARISTTVVGGSVTVTCKAR